MKQSYSEIPVSHLDRYLRGLIAKGTHPQDLIAALGNCIHQEYKNVAAYKIALDYIEDLYKDRMNTMPISEAQIGSWCKGNYLIIAKKQDQVEVVQFSAIGEFQSVLFFDAGFVVTLIDCPWSIK